MLVTVLLALAAIVASIKPPEETVVYRQPQLAAGYGRVAVAFGGGASIYFAASPDRGRSFGLPVKVADTGALALGRHRGPRLVILEDAMLITAIVGERVATGPHAHGLPEAGNLTVWRSTDAGKSWARAGVINDQPGAAREGLHAIAAAPNGKLFAVWLDLRDKGTQLYGASSSDGGLTWTKNVQVYASPDQTICQCCHPSVAADEKGGLWVMWRNVLDGSRDMHLIHAADGVHFKGARKLGTGTWKINACPMDGGGLVVTGGRLATAWRRDGEVILQEAGQPERPLGAGKDVALARGKAGLYVGWTSDGAVHIKGPGDSTARQMGPGGFVHLLALPDGRVLAAWESNGSIASSLVE